MMHHNPVEPPACPVCEQPAVKNRHLPEQLGPWLCESCVLYFAGTTREWEGYAETRARRKQLREETAEHGEDS